MKTTLEDVSPALVRMQAELAALNSTAQEKRTEVSAIRLRAANNEPNLGNAGQVALNKALGRKGEAAILPDAERLPQLLSELDLINKAIDAIHGQIRIEKVDASRLVCDKARPEHDRLAKQFAAKVLELHKAHTDYVEYCDAIERTGAHTSSLSIIQPHALGHPRDPSSGYYYSLKDFREAGFVEAHQIDERIR